MNLRSVFRSIVHVPGVWKDQASYRRAEVLHIAHLLLFFGGFAYVFIPSWILNGQQSYVLGTMLIAIVGSGLLRTGNLRLSGIWTSSIMWLLFTLGSSTEGGISSSSFAGTLTMIVFAGLTYGVGAMITFSVLTIVGGGALVFLKMHDLLPAPAIEYTQLNILADFSMYIITLALFVAVAIRRIEKSTSQFEAELRERKKTEDALRESQSLYHSFVEHLPAGVFRKDSEGRYIFVNSIFCRRKGLSADEILGKTHTELAAYEAAAHAVAGPDGTIVQRAQTCDGEVHHATIMRTGRRLETEEVHINPDGSREYLQVVKSPVFSSDGTIIGSQGIQFDVTEHRLLEHRFVQAQKLEGIGTLAGGIAHDFNNLLAMILGSAEMLRMTAKDQPALQKYVDRIIEASERGTSISRRLLIFSRPEAPEFKTISLSGIIIELREMLTHFLSKSIAIQTEIESGNNFILGDGGQIHQVILNLAINAGDAMPDGGTITIREYSADGETVRQRFGGSGDGQYAVISVSDTGAGMEPAVVEKIFDPFFTTKEKGKGTGLGLSIVHGIIKSHNGFIDVDSTPGQGTTFTMYFPLKASE